MGGDVRMISVGVTLSTGGSSWGDYGGRSKVVTAPPIGALGKHLYTWISCEWGLGGGALKRLWLRGFRGFMGVG